MTASANSVAPVPAPHRRGACPGLSAPMATGDGLLVRLMPIGTIPLAAFAELCAAARTYGNGVIEITSRGSIQVRGLSDALAPSFAAAIAALGIAADDGVPILTNALTGLGFEEIIDAGALAAALRLVLARGSLAARLGAKVSVVIDGGGSFPLDDLAADVRLCAEDTSGVGVLRIGIGGDGASATELGLVAPVDGIEAVTRLLGVLARRGPDTRARDIVAAEGRGGFYSAIADLIVGDESPRQARRSVEAIGAHSLRDRLYACGVGLAFGHTDAAALQKLIEAAAAAGANGMRVAAGRTLLAIGLTQQTAAPFASAAAQLGFIVHADDPRRHVVACAGAPICASAHIAARALAPLIAASAGPYIDGAVTIHISGCTKGCAYPKPAALTVVGTPEGCALVADGTARDIPFFRLPAGEVPATIATALAAHPSGTRREGNHV